MDIGPEVQMKTEIKGLIKKKGLESEVQRSIGLAMTMMNDE